MSRWIVFAGITAMLVNGYFAIFHERGEGLLRSVRFIPQTLQKDAEAALRAEGVNWARVQMDGQRAILVGMAPSAADREDAIAAVRRASGAGGALWGGVTAVNADQLVLAPVRRPYTWTATRGSGGVLRLTGYVPGQRMRRELAAEARKLFPGGVQDQTTVAGGQTTGDWLGTAMLALRQVARLETGEARFEDSRVQVSGVAPDARVQSEVSAAVLALKRPYTGSAELMEKLSDPPGSAEPGPGDADAESGDMTSEAALDAPDCQARVDAVMRDNVIRFAPASADIDEGGVALLKRLTATAKSCGSLKLKIMGHSDGSPSETRRDISRTRAEAAARFLLENGIAAERLRVVAAGASQPDPDAPGNAARARRVEFSVLP